MSKDTTTSQEVESGCPHTFESCCLALLTEEGSSTREGALGELCKILSLSYDYSHELLSDGREKIEEGITRGLAKGGPTERLLSAQLLTLLSITLYKEDLFPHFSSILQEIIKHDDTDAVRVAAISCFVTQCFVSVSEPHVIASSMQFLEELFQNEANKMLYRSALKGWGVLLATVNADEVIQNIFPKMISTFVALVRTEENLESKEAAGENIALLIEFQRESFEQEGKNLCLYELEGSFSVDDLINVLNELSTGSNRKKPKSELSKQRSIFRFLRSSIIEGVPPKENLTFRNQTVHFEGWQTMLQLNFIRERLGAGFQNHFLHNEFLEEMFDIKISTESPPPLTANEKRLYRSPQSLVSKLRTKERKRQRQFKKRKQYHTLIKTLEGSLAESEWL